MLKKKLLVTVVLSFVMMFAFSSMALASDAEDNQNSVTNLEDTASVVEWSSFSSSNAINQIESEENIVSYDPETNLITIEDKESNRIGVSRGAGALTISLLDWSGDYADIAVQAVANFFLSEMSGTIEVYDANLPNLPLRSSAAYYRHNPEGSKYLYDNKICYTGNTQRIKVTIYGSRIYDTYGSLCVGVGANPLIKSR